MSDNSQQEQFFVTILSSILAWGPLGPLLFYKQSHINTVEEGDLHLAKAERLCTVAG